MKILCLIIIVCYLMLFNVRTQTIGKVIIDTDGGADDALALLLAGLYERRNTDGEFKVLAITCVYGNTALKNAEQNILKTLTMLERNDIPVYSGASKPLVKNVILGEYFGKDGFGDFKFDRPIIADIDRTKPAAVALVDLVTRYSGEVSIITLGPLTNIATAIALNPSFLKLVKQLYIMGSSVNGIGNIAPNIEFNFSMDPESNFIVLNSSANLPSLVFPWETGLYAEIPLDWRLNVFGKLNSCLVYFLNKAESISLNNCNAWTPTDSMHMALAIWPKLIQSSVLKNMNPVMEGEARGTVLVDYAEHTTKPKNVIIVQKFDRQSFQNILLEYFSVAC